MKKSTKHLLSFLIASTFVTASAGAVAVTMSNFSDNTTVTASAEGEATVLDGTISSCFAETGATFVADPKYAMYSVYLDTSVPFHTGGGVYLNDHVNNFASIDLMDYIYINGKSARAIFNERGSTEEVAAKYPGFDFFLPDWAPVLVEVVENGSGTRIRVDIDRRYLPLASLEITWKACEFELGGKTYKLNADQAFKATLVDPATTKGNRAAVVIKPASEVQETLVETPFKRASKWDDFGNYYRYMISTQALTFNTAYGEWTWLMDNITYLQDYILVNGRSVAEIQKEDSKDGINFAGSPIQGNANYDFLVMPQFVAAASESYVSVNINKDWAAANGITPTTIELSIKEGFAYQGADGKIYRTSNAFITPLPAAGQAAFDTSRINATFSENGIGIFEIGTENLDMSVLNCGWHLSQCTGVGQVNEGLENYLFINGKSVAEYNAMDDTGWTYEGIAWPNDFHSAFHKPIVMNFADNKLQIFIHPELAKTLNYVDFSISQELIYNNAELTHRYKIPALEEVNLWAKDVSVTVVTGNPRLDPNASVTTTYKYGATIVLDTPTAEGKTFAGWIDVNGNSVDASFEATEDTAIYASWNVEAYTVTIKQEGEADKTFTFGVETVEGIDCPVESVAWNLASYLPEDTADYTYAWAEEIPDTFELQNYEFTVVATYITTVDFVIMGEETTVEIPAGKTAQTYPRMMGDFTFNWTGDAKILVDGVEVENGGVATLWGSFIQVIPNDSSAACTVVLTLAEYKAPATPVVLGENAITVTVDNYYCAGVEVEFTAPAAGKYVIKAAEGEENADLGIIFSQYDIEWVTLPYEIELAEGETLKILVCTSAYMTLTEDEINFIIEEAPAVITTIPEALEAEDGVAVEISGTVCEVNSAWSEQYGNISVTIVDAAGNKLYVYRLTKNVALGDIITVTGVMGSHNDSKQVAAGATAVVTGHDNSYDYVETTIAAALEMADGANVIITGTVVEINTEYSEQYGNISVTIEDENGNKLYLYRLTGNVELYNVIKVKGTMATYKEARQLTGGTYELIAEGEPPVEEPSVEDSSSSVEDSTVEDSTSEVESAPADTSSEEAKDEGCGSVIGGVALGAIALAGAAMIIRKKKED